MILLVVAAAALQTPASSYPSDAPCQDYGDGSTFAMVECFGTQSEVWDKRLNEEYRRATARAEVDRHKLRDAQRTWLRFRSRNCETYATVNGSISRILSAKCWRDMTRDRTLELREMSWVG